MRLPFVAHCGRGQGGHHGATGKAIRTDGEDRAKHIPEFSDNRERTDGAICQAIEGAVWAP